MPRGAVGSGIYLPLVTVLGKYTLSDDDAHSRSWRNAVKTLLYRYDHLRTWSQVVGNFFDKPVERAGYLYRHHHHLLLNAVAILGTVTLTTRGFAFFARRAPSTA